MDNERMQIRKLAREAAEAGDAIMVDLCNIALARFVSCDDDDGGVLPTREQVEFARSECLRVIADAASR